MCDELIKIGELKKDGGGGVRKQAVGVERGDSLQERLGFLESLRWDLSPGRDGKLGEAGHQDQGLEAPL